MTVTKEDLARRFDEYNLLYFNGELGECRFSYLYMDGFGSYNYNPKELRKAKSHILISKSVNWTEDAIKEVMIHEMIHMKIRTIYHMPIDGILGHGVLFRSECRRLRWKYSIVIKNPPFHLQHLKKRPSPKLWEKVLLFIIDR